MKINWETIDQLKTARTLIDQRENWTPGPDCFTAGGSPCSAKSPSVKQYSTLGAISVGVGDVFNPFGGPDVAMAIALGISEDDFDNWAKSYDRTHAEVLEAFDKAIAGERL